jgi:hypothetical protein
VQAVGQLDDDDANVFRHREEHLAQVLDLRVFLRLVRDPRQLGDAVDERGDLAPELLGDLFVREDGVLDDVVQQRGGDRRPVHLQVGEDVGDRERVRDVRLARGAALPLVSAVGDLVDTLQPPRVQRGVVLPDFGDEIGDGHEREPLSYLRPIGRSNRFGGPLQ